MWDSKSLNYDSEFNKKSSSRFVSQHSPNLSSRGIDITGLSSMVIERSSTDDVGALFMGYDICNPVVTFAAG